MGVNYYLKNQKTLDTIHIGKSSAGWAFTLHIDPENGISSLEDWQKLWNTPGWVIMDEYDHVIDVPTMENLITNRPRKHMLRYNFGDVIVNHDVTYDMVTGNFS